MRKVQLLWAPPGRERGRPCEGHWEGTGWMGPEDRAAEESAVTLPRRSPGERRPRERARASVHRVWRKLGNPAAGGGRGGEPGTELDEDNGQRCGHSPQANGQKAKRANPSFQLLFSQHSLGLNSLTPRQASDANTNESCFTGEAPAWEKQPARSHMVNARMSQGSSPHILGPAATRCRHLRAPHLARRKWGD